MDHLRLFADHQLFEQNQLFPPSRRGGFLLTVHKCEAATVIWHLLTLCHLEDHMTEVLENIIHAGKSVLYINNVEHALYIFYSQKQAHIEQT